MAFLIGLGVAGTILFVLAFRFPHAWMPLALGSFAALTVGYLNWSPKGAFSFAYGSTWIAGALSLWFLSSNIQHPTVLAMVGLAGLSFLTTLISAFSLKGSSQRVAGWLIGLLLVGLLVSYFSGPPGRLGIIAVLLERLGITGDTAPYIVRKVGHFTLYGILAWLATRASLAGGNNKGSAVLFAMAIALAVAGYDELRQSTHPVRVGSPTDVLIDLSGALVFSLLTRARKQNAPKQQPRV